VQPKDVLPHREPFLFVDEVTELVPGRSARGTWRLSGDEAFFAGHFPGQPVVPGVLLVEAIAQLGAIILLSDDDFRGRVPLFGGIDRARFRRVVVPGDTVDLEMEMVQVSARSAKGKGRASVAGEQACEADLMVVIPPAGT
jgi:3-hydroxyacyl-[acyl-carrier-protein] dehydratase